MLLIVFFRKKFLELGISFELMYSTSHHLWVRSWPRRVGRFAQVTAVSRRTGIRGQFWSPTRCPFSCNSDCRQVSEASQGQGFLQRGWLGISTEGPEYDVVVKRMEAMFRPLGDIAGGWAARSGHVIGTSKWTEHPLGAHGDMWYPWGMKRFRT